MLFPWSFKIELRDGKDLKYYFIITKHKAW